MNDSINIVVIDDSAFMRKSLTLMLESDPDIRVVGTAADGKEGVEKIAQLKPDLVTLDIEMPRMDGLSALKIIMNEMPLPVLMVSSLSVEGAQATIDALSLGAVDFIPKNLAASSLDIVKIKNEIIKKVKQVAGKKNSKTDVKLANDFANGSNINNVLKKSKVSDFYEHKIKFSAVLIGVSTGGPNALLKMIPMLPADFPLGVAIAQHMPANFTKTLADRLDQISLIKVKEAEDHEIFEPGIVYVAPGGQHLTFQQSNRHICLNISSEPADTLYRPSVDLMMSSAAGTFQAPLLAVIMTGMGRDGVNGLSAVKNRNGYVLAQDEESCVVFGMPKEAIAKNLVDEILPLSKISTALISLTNQNI